MTSGDQSPVFLWHNFVQFAWIWNRYSFYHWATWTLIDDKVRVKKSKIIDFTVMVMLGPLSPLYHLTSRKTAFERRQSGFLSWNGLVVIVRYLLSFDNSQEDKIS